MLYTMFVYVCVVSMKLRNPRISLAQEHQLSLLHRADRLLHASLGHVKGPEHRSIEHNLSGQQKNKWLADDVKVNSEPAKRNTLRNSGSDKFSKLFGNVWETKW